MVYLNLLFIHFFFCLLINNMAKLPIDVTRAINSQLPKEIGKKLEAMVLKEFEVIKKAMIQEFEMHPVTIEIEGGINSSNTSGTLGGYGNLFTFIGFEEGENPLYEVRARLKETVLRKTSYKNGVFDFITTEPTKEELYSMTPLPWITGQRSWMDGVETGLSGLGSYLYEQGKNIAKSRSGPAIQLKGGKASESAFGSNTTGGAIGSQRSRYKRVSYMSSILKNFNKSVYRLRASTLR